MDSGLTGRRPGMTVQLINRCSCGALLQPLRLRHLLRRLDLRRGGFRFDDRRCGGWRGGVAPHPVFLPPLPFFPRRGKPPPPPPPFPRPRFPPRPPPGGVLPPPPPPG